MSENPFESTPPDERISRADFIVSLEALKAGLKKNSNESEWQKYASRKMTKEDIDHQLRNIQRGLKPGKHEATASKLAAGALRFANVLDNVAALTQLAPGGPILWGVVKTSLQMLTTTGDLREEISKGLEVIADNLPRLCDYIERRFSGTRGQEALDNIPDEGSLIACYAIMEFLKTATKALPTTGFRKRAWRLLTGPSLLDDIKSQNEILLWRFSSVKEEREWYDRVKIDEQNQGELRKLLNSVDYQDELERHRISNTLCQWANENPEIDTWLNGDNPRLWLYGNTGTGKSTLAAHLINQAKKIDSNGVVAPVIYHFCSHSHLQQKPSHVHKTLILRSLIRQLLEATPQPSYSNPVQALAKFFYDKTLNSDIKAKALKVHVKSLLGGFRRCHIIIDGVDEYPPSDLLEDDEEEGVLQFLINLAANGIKVLFVSRNECWIRDCMLGWRELEVGAPNTTQDDLLKFIDDTLRDLATAELSPFHNMLKEHFVTHSNNMFLYVKLAGIALRNMDSSEISQESITTLLGNGMVPLHSRYQRLVIHRIRLQKEEKRKKSFVTLLQWMLCSRELLTSNLLCLVLVQNSDGKARILETGQVDGMVEAAFGPLAQWYEGERGRGKRHIQPEHTSFLEYLSALSQTPTEVPLSFANRFWSSDPRNLPTLYHLYKISGIPDSSVVNEDKWRQEVSTLNCLLDVCVALQGGQPHLQLLTTCISVLGNPDVITRWQRYYNSLDERRRRRRGRGWLGVEAVLGLHRRQWGERWEQDQKRYLEKYWEEEAEFDFDVSTNRNAMGTTTSRQLVPSQHNDTSAQHAQSNNEYDCLYDILDQEDRELLFYSFGHLSFHLIGSARGGGENLALERLTVLIYTFLSQLLQSSSQFTSRLELSRKTRTQDCAKLLHAFHSLSFAVYHAQTHITADLSRREKLSLNGAEHHSPSLPLHSLPPLDSLAAIRDRSSWHLNAHCSTSAESLWHKDVIDAVAFRQDSDLDNFFRAVSCILTKLRRAESALFALEDQATIPVGISNIVHTLQISSATIARWATVHICCQLRTRDTPAKKLDKLLASDDFIHTALLLPNNRSDSGVLDLQGDEPWRTSENAMNAFLAVCTLLGVLTPLSLWLLVITAVLTVVGDLHLSEMSLTRLSMPSALVFFTGGGLLSQSGGMKTIDSETVWRAVGTLFTFHAVRILDFRLSHRPAAHIMQHSKAPTGVYLSIPAAQSFLLSVSRIICAVPVTAVLCGIGSATIAGVIYLGTAFNIGAAYWGIRNIHESVVEPRGFGRARVQFRRLSEGFLQMEAKIKRKLQDSAYSS